MCGILGFVGDNTKKNRLLIADLLRQLSLRGTHATGFSFQTSTGVYTIEASIPAEDFVEQFPLDQVMDSFSQQIRLIGHTRYSTSDLRWNQPIQREGSAIVMNGVISQESPDKWPGVGVFDYATGNDAEIALMYALAGSRGMLPGSFACCELSDSDLLCYRNTDRPLWLGKGPDFSVVSSTQDSLKRCRVFHAKALPPGKVYELYPQGVVVRLREMDYQSLVVQLGDVPSAESLLGPEEEEFPTDPDDLQALELIYGDLKCLL